jgi:hypothetical protein
MSLSPVRPIRALIGIVVLLGTPPGVLAATQQIDSEASCVALFDAGEESTTPGPSVSWSLGNCTIRARNLTIAEGDTVRVPSGVTLRLESSSVSNAGRFEVAGTLAHHGTFLNAGELINTGAVVFGGRLLNGVTVFAGGTVLLSGAGTIVNEGTMWLDGEASDAAAGSDGSMFTNHGTVHVRSELTVTQRFVNYSSLIVYSQIQIWILGHAHGDFTGTIENLGTLRNHGTLTIHGGHLENHGVLENAWTISVSDTTLVSNPGPDVPNAVGVFENHGTFLNGLTPFSLDSQSSGSGRNAAVLRTSDVSKFFNRSGARTTNQGFVFNDALGNGAMRNDANALFENFGSVQNDWTFTNAGRFTTACYGTITGEVEIAGNAVEILDCGPTSVPGGPYIAGEGAVIQLDGSASRPTPTGAAIAAYEWDLDYSGTSFTTDLTGASPTVVFGDDVPTRTVALRVVDVDGLSNLATTTLAVHNLAPDADAGADASFEQLDRIAAQVSLNGSSSGDPGDDTLTYTWRIGATVVAGPSASPAATIALGVGVYPITLRVVDDDGGSDTDTIVITVHDTTAPDLELPPDVHVEGNALGGANLTFESATATDLVDANPVVGCDRGAGFFSLGGTTINCFATDASGNMASGAFSVFVVDTTSPVVAPMSPRTEEATGSTGASVTFELPSAADVVDGAVPVTCTPASASVFPLGTTVVSCSATDRQNNTGSVTFPVTVIDTTPPAIMPLGDLEAEATGPAGARVTWTLQPAADLVDGAVPVTCTPAAGSTFALGPTPVECSASDAAGNSSRREFVVVVVDTTPPTITTPDQVIEIATSAAGSTIVYETSAVDVVSGSVLVSCTPASGTVFAPGETTVLCEATDGAGNRATADFQVSIRFSWTGVLAPVNVNGMSIFKIGRTVPVKFALSGASSGIADLVARISLAKVSDGILGVIEEPTSTSAADTGNLFRYDGASKQYVYNLATAGLEPGTWAILIEFGDGVIRQTLVSFRP